MNNAYFCNSIYDTIGKIIKKMKGVYLMTLMLGWATVGQAAYEGRVYVDANRNGRYDKGEKTLKGVCVSDGLNVVETGADGTFSLPGHDRQRFVFITTPSGYQSDRGHFLRAEGEDRSYDFGLQEWKGRVVSDGSHRFLHVADTEIFNTVNQEDWANEVRDYAANEDAAFIVHTGDICYENGLKNHIRLMNTSNMGCPVFYGLGNHDLVKGKYGEELFESIYGPCYYSFDFGSTHYVMIPMLGGDYQPGFTAKEVFRWVKNDLDRQPEGKPVVFFNHDLLSYTDEFVFDLGNGEKLDLADYNVKGWFYGHWHNHFVRRQGKILTVSTSTLDKGGIDHSTSAFRVVDVDRKGDIETRLRYTYIDKSLAFASIANDGCVQDEAGNFLLSVNAYNTVAPVEGITYTCVGDDGKTLVSGKALAPQSDWNWQASFRLPETYKGRRVFVVAQARFSDGSVAKERTSFVWKPEKEGLHAEWISNVKANLYYTQPVVADGKVFIASLDEDLKGEGAVFALDAGNGKLLWRHQTRNSVKNTIACASGIVLAQDAEGFLYAIDAETGGLKWEQKLKVDGLPLLLEGLTVADGKVYAGTGRGFAAYDVVTGKELWVNTGWRQNQASTTRPVVAGDVVVMGTQWSGLYGNDLSSGRQLWKLEQADIRERGAAPAYVDGLLYMASGNAFFVIEPETGHIIMKKALPYSANTNSTPLVTDRLVVFGTQGRGLVALDRETWEEAWHVQTLPALVYTSPYSRHPSATVDASPVMAGKTVYFGGADGVLYGVDSESGRVIWKQPLGAPVFSSMTVSEGRMFVADYGGNVYSFRLPE